MALTARELAERFAPDELLVVGVGNPIRGDDAAGMQLARKLSERYGYELLECEDVPEKWLREMRTSQAGTVLFVDAAQMSQAPGTIRLLEISQLGDITVSTHNNSLRVVGEFLMKMADKEVLFLGIQPVDIGTGRPMTEIVEKAIERFFEDAP
ncbi:MAG: hydrogenase maturation protease [Armatimonadota bacterium]